MKIKESYNKWLFKKYKHNRGALFKGIPFIYRLCPLFSPSIYGRYEGEDFIKGLNLGNKVSFKEIDKAGQILLKTTRKSMGLDKEKK